MIWDALTAVGTIAVAVTAVGIAIWGERRTDRRIRDERERSDGLIAAEHARADRQLAEERALADKRLADQLAHSDAQLAAERAAADARLKEELAHADAELAEEHRIAREREQWAEAYAVEVTAAQMSPEAWGSRITTEPGTPIACPATIVVNRGHYAITDVYAQFRAGTGGLLPYGRTEHFSSWWNLAGEIKSGVTRPERNLSPTTLTPADAGLRFSEDARTVRDLAGSYPIIRWRDRWGTRWESRQGVVRQVAEGEAWKELTRQLRCAASSSPVISGPPGRSGGEPPTSHRFADPGRSESSHGLHGR